MKTIENKAFERICGKDLTLSKGKLFIKKEVISEITIKTDYRSLLSKII
jgi:hypothetical protein